MSARDQVAVQKLWGWRVVAHLFLAGAGAGIYIAGFALNFIRIEVGSNFALMNTMVGFILASKLAVLTSALLLILGLIFIFSHLGNKANALRAFRRPVSSWLARGSIALLVFLVLDLAQVGLWVLPLSAVDVLPGWHPAVSAITSLVALFVLIYTGMLLKRFKPFPVWNTWLLPLLFTVSGISSGIVLLVWVLTVYNIASALIITPHLVYYNNFVLVIQALLLGFYLWKAWASAKNSFLIMTRGSSGVIFWLGVVVVGLLLPLLSGMYLIYTMPVKQAVMKELIMIITVCGLAGALLLRYLVLSSGSSLPLKVEDHTVSLPDTARAPVSHSVKYR
jgi:polysulfide reductase chain C